VRENRSGVQEFEGGSHSVARNTAFGLPAEKAQSSLTAAGSLSSSTPIHPSAWKGNSRKVASRILHMRRHRYRFWPSETGMRREGDHDFW
jgi:hypothetical protein